MYIDRYDDLKEQCDICKNIGMATDDECAGCPKGLLSGNTKHVLRNRCLSMPRYSARKRTSSASTSLSATARNTSERCLV